MVQVAFPPEEGFFFFFFLCARHRRGQVHTGPAQHSVAQRNGGSREHQYGLAHGGSGGDGLGKGSYLDSTLDPTSTFWRLGTHPVRNEWSPVKCVYWKGYM